MTLLRKKYLRQKLVEAGYYIDKKYGSDIVKVFKNKSLVGVYTDIRKAYKDLLENGKD